MVYEYAAPTSFWPTASAARLARAEDYEGYAEGVDHVCFPELAAQDVIAQSRCVLDRALRSDLTLA